MLIPIAVFSLYVFCSIIYTIGNYNGYQQAKDDMIKVEAKK